MTKTYILTISKTTYKGIFKRLCVLEVCPPAHTHTDI